MMTAAKLPTTPASAKRAHRSARLFFALLIAACAQLGLSRPAQAQRVALLIGNFSYQTAPLSNPPNDVREMEAALKATGFKVQKVLNASQSQMKRAVRDFGEAASGAELAFLYYSGHGTQILGQNYLIPVGAEAAINKESDYEIEAVSINHIMGQIAAAQPKAAVVVLDSCRNNPFARSIKSAQKGMARIVSPQGILVAYATSPDNTADDNGYYAKALASHITTPGLELVQVFRNTAKQVQKSSNGKQIPFIGDLSINDSVYLASIRPEPVPPPPPQPRPVNPSPAPVPVPTPSPAPVVGAVAKCAECPEMVVIPGGSFQMGSKDGDPDEKPIHRVNIKSFELGKYEVTQGQWKAVMGSNPSKFTECGDSCPVEQVSWDEIQEYIKKLNAKSGQQYRLPSEAEWEYACRAGTSHKYCGGDDLSAVGWYDTGADSVSTHRVGGKRANAWGLYDMSGNVWEWVQDCWNDSYSGAPSDGRAWTAGNCGLRVLRGGSWNLKPQGARAAIRFGVDSSNRDLDGGFRLARIAP